MNTGFRRIAALAACTLALQFAGACAAEPKRLPTPVEGRPLKIHAGPAMWKVSDKDTTIYLFGTIHFLPRDVEWLDEDLRAALQSSGELVTEIDPKEDAKLTELMATAAFLPEGENLRDKLAPEDRMAFEGMLVSLGIPVEQFDRYKPWSAGLYLSVMMTLKAGFDPEKGVETIVAENAAPGSTRSALETMAFQVDLFDHLPQEQQIAYLNQVVVSAPTLQQDLDAMLAGWLKGDAKVLAQMMNAEESDPVLYKRLLTDRNANWARWIKGRLARPGTVFIAVGAGHLAGKGSVQDQLKKLGLRSKRVH